MFKRLLRFSLLMKLFTAILFFPACSGPQPVEEKPEPTVLSMTATGGWESVSDCLVRDLEETTRTGTLRTPSSNAMRPDWDHKESFITIRRSSDMATLYTMGVRDDGHGGSVITGAPYRDLHRDAYTDGIEAAMRTSARHCAAS